MSQLKIGLRDQQTHFRPGQPIEGALGWELSSPVQAIEVRLFWYTRGKGTQDVGVVDKMRWENPAPQGAEPFRFVAPATPCSFSGTLISLVWAIEAVVQPGDTVVRMDLVISPTGQELMLGRKGPVP